MTELDQLEASLRRQDRTAPDFYRIIGCSGKILALLGEYDRMAETCGIRFRDGLANPGEPEIARFFAAAGQQFPLTLQQIERHLTVWMGQLRPAPRHTLAAALFDTLEILRGQGANENVRRNAYVKFMCWFRSPLGQVMGGLGRTPWPKVLFEGDIGKYELFLLRILHQAGCDVWYVHFSSEASYLRWDPTGKYSRRIQGEVFSPPPVGNSRPTLTGASGGSPVSRPTLTETFGGSSVSRPTLTGTSGGGLVSRPTLTGTSGGSPVSRPALTGTSGGSPARRSTAAGTPVRSTPPPGPPSWERLTRTIQLNDWIGERPVWEAVLLSAKERGGADGRVFAVCVGGDERSVYRNRLFRLRRALEVSGKRWQLIDQPLPMPAAAETAPFRAVDANGYPTRTALLHAMAEVIQPSGVGRETVLLARRTFVQVMEQSPQRELGRLYNHGVRLACWLCRLLEQLGDNSQQPPVILWYGGIRLAEVTLLWTLAQCGVDVLYFDPTAAGRSIFDEHFLPALWRMVSFEGVLPMEPYPQREERERAGTTAYNASRELDRLLYSDTGLFRDRQFVRSQPVTLRTTYDEVGQLWPEEAQVRPSFRTENGVVYVPNLFSKISGVDKGDVALYWNRIRAMITPETRVYTTVPFLPRTEPVMGTAQAQKFFRDGRLNPAALKASPAYPYACLPDDTQDFLLEKIQALLDYDMLIDSGPALPAALLTTLLLPDRDLLGLLQNFDFTRTIPKVLIVDVTETLFSLQECILLAFLNLVGFDIAVFTPTGYRNLESHLRPDCYDSLTVGEFRFDLTVPPLRSRIPGKGGGWFSRLFGNQ